MYRRSRTLHTRMKSKWIYSSQTCFLHHSTHTYITRSYSYRWHRPVYNVRALYHYSKHHFTVTSLEDDGTLSLLKFANKSVYLIGTSHLSSESADQVRRVIQQVQPDTVFVELCPTRAAKLWAKIHANKQGDQTKDLAPLTSEEWLEELPFAKQFKHFHTRILKYLEGFGFVYGGEFEAALEEAEKINAKLVYGDRDVKETMQKMNDAWSEVWENMKSSWSWQESASSPAASSPQQEVSKSSLTPKQQWHTKSADGKIETFGKRDDDQWRGWFGGGSGSGDGGGSKTQYDRDRFENMSYWEIVKEAWNQSQKQAHKNMPQTNWSEVFSLFTNPEETIENMKDRQKIREKFNEQRKFAPKLVHALVDERDEIMAENLKKCKGTVIVAVVGIGHMDGMEAKFKNI